MVALDAGGDAYLPFVEAIVPEVDVEGGRVVVDPPEACWSSTRDAGTCASTSCRSSRLPRAAGPVAHRQGPRARACSTCASTTCATSRTTATARSTTPPTAAAPAWSCAPSRGARRSTRSSRRVDGAHPRLVVPEPGGQAVHPGDGPRAGRRAVAGLRLRPLRGHRRARARGRRRPGCRCPSSRSATTSSTGERSPCWRSSRPSPGCCPASSATPSRSSRSRTRTACSSTPSTPSLPSGAAARYPPVLLSGDHGAIAAWRHAAAPGSYRRATPGPAARRGRPRRRRPGRTPRPAGGCRGAGRAPTGLLAVRGRRELDARHPRPQRGRRRGPPRVRASGRPGWSGAGDGWSARCAPAPRRRPPDSGRSAG